MIVVDASLATKWFVAEEQDEAALTFFDRFAPELCGPDLLFTEVAGAIVRRANDNKAYGEEAREALEQWFDLWDRGVVQPFGLTVGRIDRATRIAMAIGHPLPDCIYLALAIERDCDLATCDVKFHAKVATAHPRVRLLAEFSETPPSRR